MTLTSFSSWVSVSFCKYRKRSLLLLINPCFKSVPLSLNTLCCCRLNLQILPVSFKLPWLTPDFLSVMLHYVFRHRLLSLCLLEYTNFLPVLFFSNVSITLFVLLNGWDPDHSKEPIHLACRFFFFQSLYNRCNIVFPLFLWTSDDYFVHSILELWWSEECWDKHV